MVHKVLFWGGFGLSSSPSPSPPPSPLAPCRIAADRKLEQASQSAYGNSASKCDLSSISNHYGRTRYSAAWEQASGTGCRAWTKDNRRFWERGDRVCWRRGQGGQRGRRLRRRHRGVQGIAEGRDLYKVTSECVDGQGSCSR
jgi:hypothetical protein